MRKSFFILTIIAFSVVVTISQILPVKCQPGETSYSLPCTRQTLGLAGEEITVKVFTRKPAVSSGKKIDRTFVVVHANEEKGLDASKKVISENYGRLVEVVSNAPTGKNRRYLYFGEGKANCIDPNRIYSQVGIIATLKNPKNPCTHIDSPSPNLVGAVGNFVKKFLGIVTANGAHKTIIGVHNNDPDGLSLNDWSYEKTCEGEKCSDSRSSVGIFIANNHPEEKIIDTDEFILVSNLNLFIRISSFQQPFNIALQENRQFLTKNEKKVDDGSMSIYFGMKPAYSYMNVEAQGKENIDDAKGYKRRQMKMIELIITRL